MNNVQVANNTVSTLTAVKHSMTMPEVRSRFEQALGDRASQFMLSIINAVANNSSLARCNPNSIMAAAMVAASIDLPVDPNLGFSALVPYKGICQFPRLQRLFS